MKYFFRTGLKTVWGMASGLLARFLPMSCRFHWRPIFTASKASLQNIVAIIHGKSIFCIFGRILLN
jgi:hypothetical protein